MKNIFEELKLSNETAVLICSPYNMKYFSGFSGGEGYVIITKENKEEIQKEKEIQEEEIDENFEKAQALIKEAWQYKNFNKKKKLAKKCKLFIC